MAGRRFFIDGSMAKRGGGFTFLVNSIPELARLASGDQFRLVVGDRLLADSIPSTSNLEVTYPGDLSPRDRLFFTYRRASPMAKEWNADLYFSAGETVPFKTPCPKIAMFQNPNTFTLGKGQGFSTRQTLRLCALHGLARIAARTCSRVIFVSDDSAQWMGDRIGLPLEKRRVVKHGIDTAAWRSRTDDSRNSLGRPIILSVGSVYSYKNFVRLIEAWAALARRRPELPDLAIVGDCQDKQISKLMENTRLATGSLAERIHIIGEVPYSDVGAYYRDASLFVFPSILETFGIPLLEAMASGTPIVASDMSIFREIADDAALYADPFCVPSIEKAIEDALYEPGMANTLVLRSQDRLKLYSLENTAQKLMHIFEDVLLESDSN